MNKTMSEVGIISKQYEQLVGTIDDINAAVIILKRVLLFQLDSERYKHLKVEDKDRKEAIVLLLPFMDYLVNVFGSKDEADYRYIPEKVMEKFRGSFENEDDLKGQLKAINKLLRNQKVPEKEQFELVDRIITTLDMERNKLSKKLRSARG
jgi:hypothetical protein